MNNKVSYYIHTKENPAFSSLINVYNSQIFGKYTNKFYYNDKTKDMYCLAITLKGSFKTFHNDGTVDSVEDKTIYFTNLKTIDRMVSTASQWHAIFYWFDCKNIPLPLNKFYKLPNLDTEREIDDVNRIISLLRMQSDSKLIYANSCFHFKLCTFLEEISVQSHKTSSTVDKMTSFINENVNNIKVSDISKKFNYSEKHIYHLFKTNLGISPKEFITNIRMQKVCFLLKTSDMTLQNISDKMNFASPAHLANSFKTHFGFSPTSYRESSENLFFSDPSNKK